MTTLQRWKGSGQELDCSAASSPPAYQQLSVWQGDRGQPFSTIAIHETRSELTLSSQFSETNLIVFDVGATSEAILIWGHWLEVVEAKGSCCSRPFESWVTLPHRVHPETLWITTKPKTNELIIQLAKQFNAQQ